MKLFIEALYIGGGTMHPVIDPVAQPNICDSVWIDFHDGAFPHSIIYSSFGLLDIYGNLTIQFPNVVCGTYYIAVRTNKEIETWYKYPLVIGNPNTSIDLTR